MQNYPVQQEFTPTAALRGWQEPSEVFRPIVEEFVLLSKKHYLLIKSRQEPVGQVLH